VVSLLSYLLRTTSRKYLWDYSWTIPPENSHLR